MGGYIIETIYDKQQREMDELAQKLAEKNSENEALLSENATLKSDYESLKAKLEKYEKMGLVIN